MLASLRSEVASLRENNYEMQLKLQFKDEALQGLAAKLEDSDESSSFQSRMQDLTKANDALVKEVFKYRNDSGKMKRDSQSKNLQASAKLSALAEELNRVQKLRETETKDLKDTIRLNQKLIEEERSSLKREVSLVQEKYSVDVKKLKQELSSAQTSHQEYLTKIMNVLEDTHKMREEETEKISAELRAVKEEKDNEILMLQQEVKALRVKRGGMKVKKEIRAAVDSRAIRKQLEYESDSRGRRSAQFDDIVQDLQSLVAESNALPADVEVYDLEEMAAQQERGQKMSEMVDLLNDLYRLEEDSQDKISQESLTLVEEYVGVTEPHRTVHSLRDKLANLEFENSRLLEELREKAGCKRCAVRDSAARRRIHGSATSNEPLSIES